MDHETLSTYLIGEEFSNNTNGIYETLEHDPLFNNGKNCSDIFSLTKSDYLALCCKQGRKFAWYGFPSFALAMVDHSVINQLNVTCYVCRRLLFKDRLQILLLFLSEFNGNN